MDDAAVLADRLRVYQLLWVSDTGEVALS